MLIKTFTLWKSIAFVLCVLWINNWMEIESVNKGVLLMPCMYLFKIFLNYGKDGFWGEQIIGLPDKSFILEELWEADGTRILCNSFVNLSVDG